MSVRPHPIETLLKTLAGWLPLLGGLTLLAMTLLTPEWLAWRELVWQRDMLRLQAQSLEKQRDSYAMFNDALQADDPVLLERLAYTQLRYKPTGKALINDFMLTAGPVDGIPDVSRQAIALPGVDTESSDVIDAWLAQPQPVVGKDIQPLRPINTRMTRLTRSPYRYVMLLIAGICLIAAFWPPADEDEASQFVEQLEADDPRDDYAGIAHVAGPRLRLVSTGLPGLGRWRRGA